MRIVVIGAGQAAVSFCAAMREKDGSAEITIVGEEPRLPYRRPPLSKKYLLGEASFKDMLLRPQAWYDDRRIACRVGKKAKALDPIGKRIELEDGETVDWDKLVLATGAMPRRLSPQQGGDLDGVYVLRDVSHADAVRHEFLPGRRLLVVGGGFIGLEAAAVAVSLGLEVNVVEVADRILQRVAAAETSDYFRALHASHGVKFTEGASLERIEGRNGRVSRALLANGTCLDIDFVLVSIGVMPNDTLARAAGLDVVNGIAVDLSTRTSHPDIHAAGDCASFAYEGRRIRLESIQNAIDQATAAAESIAGNGVGYAPLPWFWSDQYDVKLQIAGLHAGYDRTLVTHGPRERSQSVWYFRDDRMIAVDAINDPRSYMIGKRLLERGEVIPPDLLPVRLGV